jgi:hypothetical protein
MERRRTNTLRFVAHRQFRVCAGLQLTSKQVLEKEQQNLKVVLFSVVLGSELMQVLMTQAEIGLMQDQLACLQAGLQETNAARTALQAERDYATASNTVLRSQLEAATASNTNFRSQLEGAIASNTALTASETMHKARLAKLEQQVMRSPCA